MGDGREILSALYPFRYSFYILRERKLDNGGICVRERVRDEWPVCWGGEKGDGDIAMRRS